MKEFLDSIPLTLFSAVVGILLTLVVQYFPKILRYVFFRWFRKDKLTGIWECYIRIQENETISMHHTTISLTNGVKHKYTFASLSGDKFIKFVGYGYRENQYLMLHIHSESREYPDNTYHRYTLSNHDGYRTLIGIYLSTDYNFKACAGFKDEWEVSVQSALV